MANSTALRCMTELVVTPKSTGSVPGAAAARRHHVVIVGAGFGGLAATRALAKENVDITLIDKRNYHLFQPLLYQVASAGLSPADIAAPIRGIVAKQANARVLLGRVTGVEKNTREVVVDGTRRVPYDSLILATGARHAYFGRDEWEAHAPGLKKIEDAIEIRRRVLLAFERAENSENEAERRALLSFVVIGGGPTGVELAGALAELARKALVQDFRRIDPRQTRVILIESGARVLANFKPSLSAIAARSLERLGVELRLGAPVTSCDAHGVVVAGEHIAARCVIWAAGVAASPAAKWLGVEKDRAGRVIVAPDLSVPGHPEIFVIGDTAAARDANHKPVPGIAPAAKQGGAHVAAVIAARLHGAVPSQFFRYRHAGDLATIGRGAAVVDFGWQRLSGFAAWWLWGVAHIYFLIGFRSRVAVMFGWFWSYLTYERGARLITGDVAPANPER
jgi:NADH dehydrogenase FAD-containing subunit